MRGIKTAAAIWITGAIGLAIGTSFWWLGVVVGIATAVVLFIADQRSEAQRDEAADDSGSP